MNFPSTPRWSLGRPTVAKIAAFLDGSRGAPLSYTAVGLTRRGGLAGYRSDLRRFQLGRGEAVFAAACDAVRAWRMFPRPWTFIAPDHAPIVLGAGVAMCVRGFGLWWMNACRIVEVVGDEGAVRRFGLAYGTLPAHILQGEARFTVEFHPDGGVEYEIRAVSRMRYWPARLASPLSRGLQLRFVNGSPVAMQQAVNEALRGISP